MEAVSGVSPKMALFFGLGLLVLRLFHGWAKHRQIPGPIIASVSNIPRLFWSWSGQPHEVQMGLHKRYGKIVRLGPNCISVGDPREINNVYGTAANMPKVSSDGFPRVDPCRRLFVLTGRTVAVRLLQSLPTNGPRPHHPGDFQHPGPRPPSCSPSTHRGHIFHDEPRRV